jgi:carboxymethylenebutenolidase
MAEKEIDIETPDGLMNTFITYPDEGGPHPVALFLMDAMGKRNELHDMARRLAAAGYYVLLPNLYYRTIREYLPDWSDEEKEMEIMFGHTSTITNSMIVGDCRALLEYADRQKSAKSGPVGAVGYSMGGTFAFAAAAEIPDRINAAASIFGYQLFTDEPDSPHLAASQIEGEMYFAFAENDEFTPQQEIDNLEAHLNTLDINSRIEIYPGTVHGFTFPEDNDEFDEQATERHWKEILEMFERRL